MQSMGMEMNALLPNVITKLSDKDFSVRQSAALLLPLLAQQDASVQGQRLLAAAIVKALDDRNWRVRQAALEGLVTHKVVVFGERRLVSAVLAAVNDDEMYVYRAALYALPHVVEVDDIEVMDAVLAHLGG